MVGRTILANQSPSVHAKHHRQVWEAYIMDNLIKGPLKECGIYGNDRSKTFGGESCCKGYGMLFRDTHIQKAIWIDFSKFVETCAFGHGRSYGK